MEDDSRELPASMRPLDESLRCPVCFDLFQVPLVLRTCGHSFCSACIRASLQKQELSGDPSCPVCRAACDARDLAPNASLRGAVEAWGEQGVRREVLRALEAARDVDASLRRIQREADDRVREAEDRARDLVGHAEQAARERVAQAEKEARSRIRRAEEEVHAAGGRQRRWEGAVREVELPTAGVSPRERPGGDGPGPRTRSKTDGREGGSADADEAAAGEAATNASEGDSDVAVVSSRDGGEDVASSGADDRGRAEVSSASDWEPGSEDEGEDPGGAAGRGRGKDGASRRSAWRNGSGAVGGGPEPTWGSPTAAKSVRAPGFAPPAAPSPSSARDRSSSSAAAPLSSSEVPPGSGFVRCPICSKPVPSFYINSHVDDCLLVVEDARPGEEKGKDKGAPAGASHDALALRPRLAAARGSAGGSVDERAHAASRSTSPLPPATAATAEERGAAPASSATVGQAPLSSSLRSTAAPVAPVVPVPTPPKIVPGLLSDKALRSLLRRHELTTDGKRPELLERYRALRLEVQTANDRGERTTLGDLAARVVRRERSRAARAAGAALLGGGVDVAERILLRKRTGAAGLAAQRSAGAPSGGSWASESASPAGAGWVSEPRNASPRGDVVDLVAGSLGGSSRTSRDVSRAGSGSTTPARTGDASLCVSAAAVGADAAPFLDVSASSAPRGKRKRPVAPDSFLGLIRELREREAARKRAREQQADERGADGGVAEGWREGGGTRGTKGLRAETDARETGGQRAETEAHEPRDQRAETDARETGGQRVETGARETGGQRVETGARETRSPCAGTEALGVERAGAEDGDNPFDGGAAAAAPAASEHGVPSPVDEAPSAPPAPGRDACASPRPPRPSSPLSPPRADVASASPPSAEDAVPASPRVDASAGVPGGFGTDLDAIWREEDREARLEPLPMSQVSIGCSPADVGAQGSRG